MQEDRKRVRHDREADEVHKLPLRTTRMRTPQPKRVFRRAIDALGVRPPFVELLELDLMSIGQRND
jgi:hypothetical protein